MSTIETGIVSPVGGREESWRTYSSGEVYRCEIVLCPEEDGQVAVFVPSLPGVASQGSTDAEAEENVTEALRGAISAYQEAGDDIPWSSESYQLQPGEKARWVIVHV